MIYLMLLAGFGFLAWMAWEIMCMCIELKVKSETLWDHVLMGLYEFPKLEKELKQLRREVDLIKQQTKPL